MVNWKQLIGTGFVIATTYVHPTTIVNVVVVAAFVNEWHL